MLLILTSILYHIESHTIIHILSIKHKMSPPKFCVQTKNLYLCAQERRLKT